MNRVSARVWHGEKTAPWAASSGEGSSSADGGVATAVTYSAAGSGETYIVFWGFMAYGGFLILKGIYQASQ